MSKMEGEAELAALIRARSFDGAATLALERYGAELYGFLVNLLGSESDANEVFLQASEDLWRGLPRFTGRSTVRTWLYVLARNAATDFQRSPANRADRRAHASQLEEILAHTRTQTAPWLRTDVKEKFRLLRESLDLEDRTILVLRVDRDLAWEDVARVTLGTDSPDSSRLAREVARVTKRYQLIKQELRKRAREAGLVGE
jgi:RNA polymerase sigma-70 factor (ECF subfamily)